MKKVNILHLSDLHFGIEVSDSCPINRKKDHERALEKLIATLRTIPIQHPDWKPDVVAISGDIGWSASETDYQAATEFLLKLLDSFGLSSTDLLCCPGNHDLIKDRNRSLFNIATREHAMESLAIDNLQYRCSPFEPFANFAQKMNISPLNNNAPNHEALPYIYGWRDYKGLRFVVFNTAWNCRGKTDKGNLWIGESTVNDVESIFSSSNPLTVTLMHHPFADLHDNEQRIYENHPVVQEMILKLSDIILTGHVHGEIRVSDCLHGKTRVFTSSAAYDRYSFNKGCQIIQLDLDLNCFSTLVLRFNTIDQEWDIKENFEEKISLVNTHQCSQIPVPIATPPSLSREEDIFLAIIDYIHNYATCHFVRVIDSMTLSKKIRDLGGKPNKIIDRLIELGELSLRIIGTEEVIRSYNINNCK